MLKHAHQQSSINISPLFMYILPKVAWYDIGFCTKLFSQDNIYKTDQNLLISYIIFAHIYL